MDGPLYTGLGKYQSNTYASDYIFKTKADTDSCVHTRGNNTTSKIPQDRIPLESALRSGKKAEGIKYSNLSMPCTDDIQRNMITNFNEVGTSKKGVLLNRPSNKEGDSHSNKQRIQPVSTRMDIKSSLLLSTLK